MINSACVQITQATSEDIDEAIRFVMAARAEIFPMLDSTVLPADLQRFAQVYVHGEAGAFWLARCAGRLSPPSATCPTTTVSPSSITRA